MTDLMEWLAYMARRVWCRIVGHAARPFCDRCDEYLADDRRA